MPGAYYGPTVTEAIQASDASFEAWRHEQATSLKCSGGEVLRWTTRRAMNW
jgi:hypothetical protein